MIFSLIDFVRSLNVVRCRVQETPQLIFLCGGKIARGRRPYKSARDYFWRYLRKEEATLALRVRLAEDVNSWFREENERFSDLLELEEYLAHLSDIIILFVESPGSIAELGAFAASDILRYKTLAVINNQFGSSKSFIADGPVRRLKNHNGEFVHYFKWDPDRLSDADTEQELIEIAEELSTFLKARDAGRAREVRFDPNRHPGHVLLLIADLIGIPGVASRSDIAKCLEELHLPSTDLDRQLSVLKSLNFVTTELRSNQTFYINPSPTYFIRYSFEKGAINDAARIRDLIRRGLDDRRKGALRYSLHKRSHGGGRA